MEEYIKNYETFDKSIVYNFNMGDGGIGDCIKFFMYILEICIKYKYKLYYQINNIPLEKYLKLRYTKMYIHYIENIITINDINTIYNICNNYNIMKPQLLYQVFKYEDITINIQDVFYFTDDVINNRYILLPDISNYISLHLRLGDKYLETSSKFVLCKDDSRTYSEDNLFKFIEENCNIIFFCDNNNYKRKIKEKYDKIIITKCDIGHTSLSNTTDKQVLDTITEFYIMTESQRIYYASNSGFSIIASKFKNIPLINII